eukprot:CAMPEP_0113588630 /NCGR_PEP_ID=MMETSP0015_2-20120614/35623_1 /TAXON_ID=2838 /ORGANISM="Odontella" /LENGTH=65 /DNA_ID=CAMNT_0000494527 /DNA_START=148 /DNA_END=342 /DNA_ORIENTATION=- /assembly_acc=CAM_ASM_000160
MPFGWNCGKCTYFHRVPSPRCVMCGELRNATREQMRDFVTGTKHGGDGRGEVIGAKANGGRGSEP